MLTIPATKASAHAPAQTHRGSLEIIGYKVRVGTPNENKMSHAAENAASRR